MTDTPRIRRSDRGAYCYACGRHVTPHALIGGTDRSGIEMCGVCALAAAAVTDELAMTIAGSGSV